MNGTGKRRRRQRQGRNQQVGCSSVRGEVVAGDALRRYSIHSSSWGGAWGSAAERGEERVSRPRFRSISSAVRRLVTMAMTLRLPPQGHCHTSTPQVLACKVAQSSLGFFFFAVVAARASGGGG